MRYATSKSELERVKQLIPLASQTFSKAYTRWPEQAPHFLSHGKGGRVWDVDGNEYVDLVSALLPNVLGYCDSDVDAAIRHQLGMGISFSLPTLQESALAGRLVRHIPCAEMVRFGKSGTDATSAAVRLARAVTGRDHVVMHGYHGWQDWSIGQADTVEHQSGVPDPVRALTFKWEDWIVRPHAAAVIVDCSKADIELLQEMRDFCDETGALLVFDEVITGFRYDIGGAQTVFGITPDLACFSKAMGNGMPISAIVGRKELMKNFDHVFFSGTFGGETLSIAAAIACIDKIDRLDVCAELRRLGNAMVVPPNPYVGVSGHPSCRQLNFASPQVREMFLNAMLEKGVLVNTAINVCWAHTMADIDQVQDAYGHALNRVTMECAA